MRTDADHMTILCVECGLEPGEACSFLCLGWVTREEIEEHSLDVRVIASYRTPAGVWCPRSTTAVLRTTCTSPASPRAD
jgi:hypothetical protein